MEIVRTAAELRSALGAWRREGHRVGFVPTMGALHAGHLSLVEIALRHSDRAVASVFVNPTQFGPNEDFSRYPRQPEKDAELLASAGCGLLFLPSVDTMYPPGSATFVEPGGAALGLEGACRPGHFRGVATVVSTLFHLVQPDVAVFGEKDAQQLAVLQQLVRDLSFPIEIVPGSTLREPDGLAMSSRNAYLSAGERQAALVLIRSLRAAESAIHSGERSGDAVRALLLAILNKEPLAHVEYAEIVDAETFQPIDQLRGRIILPLAVRVGGTRLIDNVRLAVGA